MGVSSSECIQVALSCIHSAGVVWDSDWLSKENVHACDCVEGSLCHEAVYHLKVFFKGENFSICMAVDDLLLFAFVPLVLHIRSQISFFSS